MSFHKDHGITASSDAADRSSPESAQDEFEKPSQLAAGAAEPGGAENSAHLGHQSDASSSADTGSQARLDP